MDVIEHIRQGVLIDKVGTFKVVDQVLMLKQPMGELVFISGGGPCGGLSFGEQICRLISGHPRFLLILGNSRTGPFPSNAVTKDLIEGKIVRFFCQNIINFGKIPALRYLIMVLFSEISHTLLQISSTVTAFCSPSTGVRFQDS